ncbi:hypothetical protein VTL71DRAFT_4478 [Oculimacula yallundae]|uniref:Uncharacterized protein n=1 Tax=Oculimacula yallundae TaxID=86028 RepID=A0ABR4C251_9HELO
MPSDLTHLGILGCGFGGDQISQFRGFGPALAGKPTAHSLEHGSSSHSSYGAILNTNSLACRALTFERSLLGTEETSPISRTGGPVLRADHDSNMLFFVILVQDPSDGYADVERGWRSLL